MAVEKEEVILEFKVDQKDALSQMEQTKKSILQIKEEQKQLNKALKDGDITLDEYVADSVRLEGILKKQQSTYNTLQKSVTGVKTQLDKLIESNQKISKDLQKTSQVFKDAANNINVAGVNVGTLTTKIAAFNNPASAAVVVVGALGAAYARSTVGAKDLEFAQNQLAAATTLVTNRFAELISSAEDGEGAVTNLFNTALNFASKAPAFIIPRTILGLFGIDIEEIRKTSKELAAVAEQIEDKQREELDLRIKANEALEKNQELLTDIQSDQTSYNDKLDKTNEMITNIRRGEEEVKTNLNEQLKLAQTKLENDKANETLLDAQNAILKEISALEKDAEKRVQGISRLQQNITEQNAKQLKIESEKLRILLAGTRAQAKAAGVDLPKGVKDLSDPNSIKKTTKADEQNTQDLINGDVVAFDATEAAARATTAALIELDSQRTDQAIVNAGERQRANEAADQAALQSATIVAGALAGLAEEGSEIERALALTSIAADTASALTGGISAAQSVPFPGNIVAMASTIAAILGNIASAKRYLGGAAAGGGDFMTTGPTMLMVGDNPGGRERVTVEPISGKGNTVVYPHSNLVKMAGGGSLTTGDGGFSVNTMTAETNQSLLIANSMKRMPAPIVGVEEFTTVQNRVRIKQVTAKIGGKNAVTR